MTHTMKLRHEPFYKIKNGLKTVELRLYDEKRQKISVSDEIIFTLDGGDETVRCRVLELYRFASFSELYSALPLADLGYTGDELVAASPRDMEQYYSSEDINAYGVIGIRIKLLNRDHRAF